MREAERITSTVSTTPPPRIARSARMRVFAVDPIGGHGGMYLYDLAFLRALSKQDVDVTWVTCDETTAQVDGYELWTPFRGIYGQDHVWRRGARYVRGLWAVLRRAQEEVKRRIVVIHQQFVNVPPCDLAFAMAARGSGISCIMTAHDVTPYRGLNTRWLLPVLYRHYDALIVHSMAGQAELRKILRTRSPPVYLIPHGHYNESHGDGARMSRSFARSRLGLSGTGAVVLFLGHIREEKGLVHLLRAFPAVLRQLPDSMLLVAGRPWHNDVRTYETLIHELHIRSHVRVRWEYVPDEELPLYYRAADVVALPYTRVYQSGVCLTAYAFRRPVVASAVGGLMEQVLDGETGYLVPPGDSGALAAALVRAINDRTHAETMGEVGHLWAERVGNYEKIAEQTLQVYRNASRAGGE